MTAEEAVEYMEQFRAHLGFSKCEMSRQLGYTATRYHQWTKNPKSMPRACIFFLKILKAQEDDQ